MNNSLEQVKKALMSAVKTRIPKEKFGILFSGGLDSVLLARICRELKADIVAAAPGARVRAGLHMLYLTPTA